MIPKILIYKKNKTHNICNFINIKLEEQKRDFLLKLEAKNYAMRTLQTYRCALDRFFSYIYSVKKIKRIQDIDVKRIDKYQTIIRKEGVSTNSREVYLRAVKLFFTFLEENGTIFFNPLNEFKKLKHVRKIQECPTMEEMIILLNQPDTLTPIGIRDRAILEITYSAGLRLNELVPIKIQDIDLRDGLLKVIGKGDKERTVPIGKQAVHWTDEYLKNSRPRLLKNKMDYNHLWLGAYGDRINSITTGNMIKNYAREARINTHITTHAIRRACATHMLQNGAHPAQIQMLLGHASMLNLSQYLQLGLRDIKEMHNKSKVGK